VKWNGTWNWSWASGSARQRTWQVALGWEPNTRTLQISLNLLQFAFSLYQLCGDEVAQSVCWLGYELDDRDSILGTGNDFLFATASRPVLGPTKTPIDWVTEVKRPSRGADYSLPSGAEIKNSWSCTSTPPHVFLAWYLLNHRGNFTFYMDLEQRTVRTRPGLRCHLPRFESVECDACGWS
jgi:hypothetical protein